MVVVVVVVVVVAFNTLYPRISSVLQTFSGTKKHIKR